VVERLAMPKRKASAAAAAADSEQVDAAVVAPSDKNGKAKAAKRQRPAANAAAKAAEDENSDEYEGPVEASSSGSSDSESSGSDSGDEEGEIELDGQLTGAEAGTDDDGIMQINFDFCDPDERFFHGIKSLLASYLPQKASVSSSELTDMIIAQGAVGTIVVQDGADDAFAFMTALPLQFHKDKVSCIYQPSIANCTQHII
jgi:BCCIP